MDGLKRALESIKRMWGNLNASQRVILAAASAGMVLLLVWGSAGVAGDSMQRIVGHEVSEAERGEILKTLQEKQVRYDIRNLEIWVPREDAERVVLELAGDGVMSDKAVWQWLANSDIVASKWQLEKRYQVALQRQLQGMIRRIHGVRNASVILSPASEAQQLGFKDGAKASASVQVELASGAVFGNKQAKAIAGLVARAVPDLSADRVHVMDTGGNAYHIPREGGGAGYNGELRDLEARLEDDIKAKIEALFPSARTVVRVIADGVERVVEEKTHEKPLVTDTEDHKRIEKMKPTGGIGGIKGEGRLNPEEATTPAREETEQDSKEKSIVNVKYTKDIIAAGTVKKITVGVLIPQDPEDKDKLQLTEVKALIAKAAGLDSAVANEALSVMFVPTMKPGQIAPTPMSQQVLEILQGKWTTLVAILFALIGLVMLFRIVRGAAPRGTVEEIQNLAAQLGEGPEIDVPPSALSAQDNINRVKQGIQDVISKNPAGAAVGLKQWMGEQSK
jgi:flagellar M-ring protein FliF